MLQHLPAAFLEIDYLIIGICGPYEQSWLSGVYAFLRYAPDFISLALYIVVLRYKEIYLFLFSLGLTEDGFLNHFLNHAYARTPRILSCTPLWGSAVSYQAQHASFFSTFLFGYMALYQPRAKVWHIIGLVIFMALVFSGSHFMHFHHSDAILNGVIVGALNAVVYQTFLHWLILPRLCRILSLRWVRYLGYMDSLCLEETTPIHVIAVEEFDERFPQESRVISREKARDFVAQQTF